MINSLTSLRFIFALMVFGAHCYTINAFFDMHCFKEGFVGVSFFFVLSGFIIAYNYQSKLTEHQITKRTFWVARMARVYPLHWLTLCIAAMLGGGYVVANGTADWCRHFLASLVLVQAYIPRADYFFSFNSPSWSLCYEQLFFTYVEWQKCYGWNISWMVSVPALFCIVLLLSLASYYYFEKPMNKQIKKLLNK